MASLTLNLDKSCRLHFWEFWLGLSLIIWTIFLLYCEAIHFEAIYFWGKFHKIDFYSGPHAPFLFCPLIFGKV